MKTTTLFIQRVVPIPGGGTCNNPIKGCGNAAPIDDYIPLLLILATIAIIYFVKKHQTK